MNRGKGRPAALTPEQQQQMKDIVNIKPDFPRRLLCTAFGVSKSTVYKLLGNGKTTAAV